MMTCKEALVSIAACVAGLLIVASANSAADGVAPPNSHQLRIGKNVFKASCGGCHKWHGGGGGGYGGAALSLRQTQLDRAMIIETVSCGRPGTGMPSHKRDAYKDGACYGLTKEAAGNTLPPVANDFLSPSEIEAVADYVIANVKGKGDPTLEECEAFWGQSSAVCNELKKASADEQHSEINPAMERVP
ncbi:MAG: c-type cytochrome [Hyphomicrobium sp.]